MAPSLDQLLVNEKQRKGLRKLAMHASVNISQTMRFKLTHFRAFSPFESISRSGSTGRWRLTGHPLSLAFPSSPGEQD